MNVLQEWTQQLPQPDPEPPGFAAWLDAVEGFSTRRERAGDELGPRYKAWLLAAYRAGHAAALADSS